MKPKIFITPWIDLTKKEIQNCINAGVDSVRIHTGKASINKINELIEFYDEIKFKFYLDLRGNKAQAISTLNNIKLNDEIVFYADNHATSFNKKSIKLNFIPQIINEYKNGDFTIDDGRIVFQFQSFEKDTKQKIIAVHTIVTIVENNTVHMADGLSSMSIPIHTYLESPFTEFDINILKNINSTLKDKIKYVVVSFAESGLQLIRAKTILNELDYSNVQIVPKVETVKGMLNINEINNFVVSEYGNNAEIQIGRSDLTLDIDRYATKPNIDELIDNVIAATKAKKIKLSILAMIMQSLRFKLKNNPNTKDLSLTEVEESYIKKLCDKKVYQIGLTNEVYVDNPVVVINELKKKINKYSN